MKALLFISCDSLARSITPNSGRYSQLWTDSLLRDSLLNMMQSSQGRDLQEDKLTPYNQPNRDFFFLPSSTTYVSLIISHG